MKQFVRSICVVALASLVMAGCTKDPDGVTQGTKVSFSSNIAPLKSRVDGSAWSHGDAIGVYMLSKGGSISNPTDIVSNAANRNFRVNAANNAYVSADESQAIFYPLTLANPAPDGHDFDFVAYHPYTATAQMENYSIPVSIVDNKPVLTATGVSKWPDYTQEGVQAVPVDLRFQHRMARIKFNIKAGEGMVDGDLKNLIITYVNANAKGKFNIIDNKFEDIPLAEALASTNFMVTKLVPTKENVAEGIIVTGSTAKIIMIPNTGTKKNSGANFDIPYRSIIFKVKNNSDKPGETSNDLNYNIADNMVYEAGKEYTYNVTILRDQVVFEDVQIDEWEPEPELTDNPEDIETMDRWTFRRSIYNPNSYVFLSSPRNPNVVTYDKLTIPIMKAFSMWELDPWLSNSSFGPIPDLSLPINADKNIDVEIIWGDNPEVKKYIVSFTDPRPTYKSSIVVLYDSLPAQGIMARPLNMLVGIKVRGEDAYRWTWHVWVVQNNTESPLTNMPNYDHDGARDGVILLPEDPDFDPLYPRGYSNTDFVFMSRNLGARLNDLGGENTGLYYQWGRPTPFPGAENFGPTVTYAKLYDANGVEITAGVTNGLLGTMAGPLMDDESVAQMVLQPTKFVTSTTGNWVSDSYFASLWKDSRKSPWDPCPSGYRVPAFKNKTQPSPSLSPWNNPQILYTLPTPEDPTLNRSTDMTPAKYAGTTFKTDANSKGYLFTPVTDSPLKFKMGWYPASGYRSAADGALTELGTQGYTWASTLDTDNSQQFFNISETQVNPYGKALDVTATARPLRCVKE